MTRWLTAFLLCSMAGVATAAEVELGYGYEFLTRGYDDWRTLSLDVAWVPAERAQVGFALRRIERFDWRDHELAASAYLPWGEKWGVEVEASASATHHVIPAWTGVVRLQYVIGGGVVASSGVKWSRYLSEAGASSTGLGQLGLEYYWGLYRLSWTGYFATLEGAWSLSQRLGWDRYYGERNRVGLGFAAGHELENTSGSRPLDTPVISATLGGRQWISDDWAFTYEVGVHRQGDHYLRTGGRIGLRRQF